MAARRGFTLVETLVVIAVIAVLLGITLPFLRRGLGRTDAVIDLANLRSTHQQFYEWGVEHRDRFVNQGPPQPGEPFVLRAGNSPGTVVGVYGMQETWWTWTHGGWLQEGYSTWHPRNAPQPDELEAQHFAMLVGHTGGQHSYPSSFAVSRAVLFDPRMFLPGCYDAPVGPLMRYVRWGETAHPGQKALLHWTGTYSEESEAVSVVAFVDGSTRAVSPSSAITVPGEPCSNNPFSRTPMGILGVDVQ